LNSQQAFKNKYFSQIIFQKPTILYNCYREIKKQNFIK